MRLLVSKGRFLTIRSLPSYGKTQAQNAERFEGARPELERRKGKKKLYRPLRFRLHRLIWTAQAAGNPPPQPAPGRGLLESRI